MTEYNNNDDNNDELIKKILEESQKHKNIDVYDPNDCITDSVEKGREEEHKVTLQESPPEYNYNKKKLHKKKKKKRHLLKGFIVAIIIIIIAVFLSVFIISVSKDLLGLSGNEEEIIIEIPSGANIKEISQILKDNTIIDNTLAFELSAKMNKADKIKAGKHTVTSNMTYKEIIDALQADAIQEKVSVSITFPEGKSLYQCALILEENNVCNADEFIDEFNNASFGYEFEELVSNSKNKFYKMEGYCFPDTYVFFENSNPEVVAKKIYARYAEMVNANILGRIKDLGITLDETMSFAAMVQAEAPEKSQMRLVASVFWNRLNNSEKYPKLQSDPTRKYVEEVIIPNSEIENKELETAYNTYEGIGLPPGAICNPGIDAIEAVLYPEETDYYYFCSNLESREFYYAKTDAEHERNLVLAGLK